MVDPPVQIELASISQFEFHPSPLFIFPSSHSSNEYFIPSPQTDSQILFIRLGEVPAIHSSHESFEVIDPSPQT